METLGISRDYTLEDETGGFRFGLSGSYIQWKFEYHMSNEPRIEVVYVGAAQDM